MSDEKKLLNRLIEIGIQNPIQLEENDIFSIDFGVHRNGRIVGKYTI